MYTGARDPSGDGLLVDGESNSADNRYRYRLELRCEDRVLVDGKLRVGGKFGLGEQDHHIARPHSRYKEPPPPLESAPLFLEIREVGIQGAETSMYFRHDWLIQHGINPARSIVLGVSGESMEPTVPDGASVLVDRYRQELRSGSVFVVRTGGALVVKRAGQDADGRWLLVSDHVGWPDEPWPDDADVFGEVKWVATPLP